MERFFSIGWCDPLRVPEADRESRVVTYQHHSRFLFGDEMDGKMDWYSPAGAARLLGLTPRRLRQMMAAGRVRHIWTPNGRLIPEAEVLRLLDERRAAGRRVQVHRADAQNDVEGNTRTEQE